MVKYFLASFDESTKTAPMKIAMTPKLDKQTQLKASVKYEQHEVRLFGGFIDSIVRSISW